MTHKKPTEEELQKGIQDSIDAIENPQDEEEEENEDTQDNQSDNQEEEEESSDKDNEQDEAEEGQDDEEADEIQEDTQDQEDIDYKKKFSESSREAQKINAKNRKIIEAIDDVESIPKPTEEELIKEFPEYDVMTDSEKKFAEEALISRKWREKISQAREEGKKIEKWEESVKTFIENPENLIKYPKLEGKEQSFREFAGRDENTSVPFNLLVQAFLYEQSTQVKKNRGKMFEKGTSGPSNKGEKKSTKLTPEEGRKLMKTDFKTFKKKLLAGQIANE